MIHDSASQHHHVNHGLAILDVVDHEHADIVLAQLEVLTLLGLRGLLATALKLAKPDVTIGPDEQAVGHSGTSGLVNL